MFYGAAEDAEDAEDEDITRVRDQMDGTTQAPQDADQPCADLASGGGIPASGLVDSSDLDWPTANPPSFAFATAMVEYADGETLLDVRETDPNGESSWVADANDRRIAEVGADQNADSALPETAIADPIESDILGEVDVGGRIAAEDPNIIENIERRDQSSVDVASLPNVSQDADLTRLMASVEAQMDDVQTVSSRETYDQMRAAVAAADDVNDDLPQNGDATAYCDGLTNPVRPRRTLPTDNGTRTPRPAGDSRPAPLKLVAEQRVDLPHTLAPASPVHPRRVALASSADGPISDGGGFAQFAEDVGATGLPDLLEAAAAYLSFVEHYAQFSRPQLINTVRQLDDQSFNREDGLHSFGELLRVGKIAKAAGGCFTASEDIGFRPDKRAVG